MNGTIRPNFIWLHVDFGETQNCGMTSYMTLIYLGQYFLTQIEKQFPGDVSFGQLLEEAATYKSTPGEDLQSYCFKKLGKLNKLKLEIAEDKLVDFVVHGIHDDSIRTAISVARCKNLHELYACINSFHIQNNKQKDFRKPRQNDGTSAKAGGRDGKVSNTCHTCRQPGHYKRNCPENRNSTDKLGPRKTTRESNKNEKRTGRDGNSNKENRTEKAYDYCGKKNHTEEVCYKKSRETGGKGTA